MSTLLKNNLKVNGWCIIDLEKKIIQKIKKSFQNKVYSIYPDFKKLTLEELRQKMSMFKFNQRLNKIKMQAFPNLSDFGFEGIQNSLNSIFARNSYLLQRNSHIDINVAKNLFTKTRYFPEHELEKNEKEMLNNENRDSIVKQKRNFLCF